jgi:hypothetical protein
MAISINRTFKLPGDQFFQVTAPKTGICLHHTVGGSAQSTFSWWCQSSEMVGTAYIVDRDGTIYETFNPNFWAWQFGLPWPLEEKTPFEKRFIGIEIASEGGLIEQNGKLYCFDRISDKTLKKRTEAFDYGQIYRGYRYFDKYEQVQIDSVIELVDHLCRKFNIEKRVPLDYLAFHDKKLFNFQGIIGHTNVRLDKSDPAPDVTVWEKVINDCGLTKVAILNELEELFEYNVTQFSQLDRAAAAVVKGLLYEAQRGDRNTYIKLYNPQQNGHIIYYKMIQGSQDLVKHIAGALGFMTITDNMLEVAHG